ncbi:MAG: hypothetical protein ACR2QV_14455 [Gammaproteobacteria bacterium]
MQQNAPTFAAVLVTAICIPVTAIAKFDELMALVRTKPSACSAQ